MRAAKREGLIPAEEFRPGFMKRLFGKKVSASRRSQCSAFPWQNGPQNQRGFFIVWLCFTPHESPHDLFTMLLANASCGSSLAGQACNTAEGQRALGEKAIHSHG